MRSLKAIVYHMNYIQKKLNRLDHMVKEDIPLTIDGESAGTFTIDKDPGKRAIQLLIEEYTSKLNLLEKELEEFFERKKDVHK